MFTSNCVGKSFAFCGPTRRVVDFSAAREVKTAKRRHRFGLKTMVCGLSRSNNAIQIHLKYCVGNFFSNHFSASFFWDQGISDMDHGKWFILVASLIFSFITVKKVNCEYLCYSDEVDKKSDPGLVYHIRFRRWKIVLWRVRKLLRNLRICCVKINLRNHFIWWKSLRAQKTPTDSLFNYV